MSRTFLYLIQKVLEEVILVVNSEIHIACVSNDIKKYQIAEKLGITDTAFSRKLRTELKKEEKEKILKIISELSKSSKNL